MACLEHQGVKHRRSFKVRREYPTFWIIFYVISLQFTLCSKLDNSGGGIFIYSCSQTIKTIDFKRN